MILLKNNMLNSAIWYSALDFLRPATALLLLPMYLTYITPADYGLLALIGVFSAFFAVLANLKLDNAMRTFYFDFQQSPAQLIDYLRTILSASILSSVVLVLIMLVSGPFLFGLFFGPSEIEFYPLGLIAIAAISIGQISTSYFIYLQNQGRLAEFIVLRLVGIICVIVTQVILVVFYDMGIKGILLGNLLSALLVSLFIFCKHPKCLYTLPNWKLLSPSFKFSMPIVLLGMLIVFEGQIDRLVLERFVDLSSIGIYALLLTFLGIFSLVFNAIDNAIRPYMFTLLKRTDNSPLATHFLSLYVAIGLTTLVAISTLGMNLDLLVKNEQYHQVKDWIFPAVLAFLPVCVMRFYALTYMFYKKSISLTIWTGLRVLTSFGLLILLVPKWGISGAIWSIGIGHVLSLIIYMAHTQVFIKIQTDIKGMLGMLTLFFVTVWSIPSLFNVTFSGIYSLLISFGFPIVIYCLHKHNFNSLFKLNLTDNVQKARQM